ncbi:hypothetical protein BS78_09G097700 [Paspalum vaginatum]|nr:hypothetical protein BS78_09G097700 [Paspalum vaginatum]
MPIPGEHELREGEAKGASFGDCNQHPVCRRRPLTGHRASMRPASTSTHAQDVPFDSIDSTAGRGAHPQPNPLVWWEWDSAATAGWSCFRILRIPFT